jgi:surface-anchored protein/uncharacterized repeat protein (TIGR01451 family)
VLAVVSNNGFAVGDTIVINPGGSTEETHSVAGIGSLILAQPLLFSHDAGEVIKKVTLPPTPTSTAVPTSTKTPVPAKTNTPTRTPTRTPTPVVGSKADLRLHKSVLGSRPVVGGYALFIVKVENLGPDKARNVVVKDDLPPQLKLLGAVASQGSYSAANGNWNVGDLGKHRTATLYLLVKVVEGGGELIINTATATSQTMDPAPGNNTAAASISPVAARTVFSQGHIDVDIGFEDGEIEMVLHDHDNDVEYDPNSVLLHVKREAKTRVPSDPRFAFLGRPGAPIWVLPQVEDPEVLFPSWATVEVPLGELQGDVVQLRLVSVAGPGKYIVYAVDGLAAPTLQLKSDGGPKQMTLAAGGHTHSNWVFTAPGRYLVTFEATAKLTSGEQVSTGPVTLTLDVDFRSPIGLRW